MPILLNNRTDLDYRVPLCALFSKITEKCGAEIANLMTCKNYCLKALGILKADLEPDVIIDGISMEASTAKEGYCEFCLKNGRV